MGFKRPGNTKTPCRMCLLQGVSYNNTYYYPHHPHSQFKANNLPLRTRVRRCIKDVIATHCSETEKEWGIVSESIFLELNSVHFPRSFPIDLMHCILQNITHMLYSLWNGSKLSIDRSSTYEDQNAGDWPPYNIGKPASILEPLEMRSRALGTPYHLPLDMHPATLIDTTLVSRPLNGQLGSQCMATH